MTSSTESVPRLPLAGGVEIPQLGFGVFQVPPEETADVAGRALAAGYRHIDTAAAYGNEEGVADAIEASALSRDEIFVTTKCFNNDHGYDEATRALESSLERLRMDQVDLYLIHWPVPTRDRYVDTWRAFIDAQEKGLVRAIGVSNFNADHLDRLVEETGVTPTVNQVELHPRLQQPDLRQKHEELGIVTEAWSPLAQGEVLDDPAIGEIAEAHGKTAAQVVIRWHLQIGNVVIPKSVTQERIEANFDVFDFELDEGQLEAIEELDQADRIGPDPRTFVAP